MEVTYLPVQVAWRPAELCPEGLLSVGKTPGRYHYSPVLALQWELAAGMCWERNTVLGRKLLTESLRSLGKCIRGYTESHQPGRCREMLSPATSQQALPASVHSLILSPLVPRLPWPSLLPRARRLLSSPPGSLLSPSCIKHHPLD